MKFLRRFDLHFSRCQSYSNSMAMALSISFYLNDINNDLSVNENISKNSNVFNITGSYFCKYQNTLREDKLKIGVFDYHICFFLCLFCFIRHSMINAFTFCSWVMYGADRVF